jgi:hypothetical protein
MLVPGLTPLVSCAHSLVAEIKNYYNDITHNNLDLIKTLKEDVAEMKKREAQVSEAQEEEGGGEGACDDRAPNL